MPQEVELVLIANNKGAVKGIRELATESKNLWDSQEKAQKRQVGLIADIEKELTKLKEGQRNAMTIEHIEKYNKKIAEAKQALKEYEEVGVKVEKQTESLSKTIGKWALGLGGATAALGILKEAVVATTTGLNAFNIIGAASKQVLYNLVTGAQSLTAGLTQVIAAQKELNKLRIQDKIDTYNSRIEMLKFNEALIEAKDQTKSVTERIKSYDEAIAHKKKSTDIEIKSTEDQLKAYEKILKAAPDNEKATIKYIELQTELVNLRVHETSAMKEISSMRSGLLQSQIKEQNDALDKIRDLGSQLNDAFASDSQKFWTEYDKWFNDMLNKEAAALQKMKNENTSLADDIQKSVPGRGSAILKRALQEPVSPLIKMNEGVIASNKELLQSNLDAEKSEEDLRQKRLDALKEGLNTLLEFTQEITDRQVEIAQRNRELLDTRISETQSALNTEVELYKAGYASNVAAKQKELEELKKQRTKALRDEEEALRKQRLMESIAQGVNIFTSTTQILKSFTKFGPAGLALAAGAITAMFTLIANAKQKTSEMSGYAKGGWTGEGKQRDITGERVAGIVHEREFVVKRGPANKFRDVLEAINKDDRRAIFNSFNKLVPEVGGSVNNILVENNGPNKRLDEVNSQLRRMNNREEVSIIGNMTIYKKGNNVRVIKNR